MRAALTYLWHIKPLLLTLGLVGWVLWRWLKATDEPLDLIVRWLVSALIMGYVLRTAVRAGTDESARIVALLVGCVGGLIMAIIWRRKFCEFIGDLFGSLYTGGSREVDPAPFYSIAQGRRKQGKYADALAEVRSQLERFPTDFNGWMLLAEIQAEDLKDLASAHETIEEFLRQDGHAPKNIAYALNREAVWYLKLAQDRDAARVALEMILLLLPDTEQAQLAHQRLAHLTPEDLLADQHEPRRLPLQPSTGRLGLQAPESTPNPALEDPAAAASALVAHLEEFPLDNEARERLAQVYVRHYQRLDLATDQLEQLIAFPNQPPKQVVHWLNLLADLQIEMTADAERARQTLQRIVDLYPKSAAAESALNRMAYLKLELRPKQTRTAIKLGSYEQNIGLKRSTGRRME
jgi:outer membrane protein assembly factor BamD (BamD/ComL family)